MSELRISRESLLDGLSYVLGVTPSRPVLPYLSNLLISFEGKPYVYATDLELFARSSLDCSFTETSKILVNSKHLFEIVKKLPPLLSLKLVLAHGSLKVTCGNSEFTLPSYPPEEYPEPFSEETSISFSMRLRKLIQLLDSVSFSASKDERRPALQGIFMKAEDGWVTFCASDGYRLALIEDEVGVSFDGLILPAKVCSILKKIAHPDDEITIKIGKTSVTFESGKRLLTSRVIDDKFPDYESIIPKRDNFISLRKDQIEESLERVLILPEESAVIFDLKDQALTLTAESPHGKAIETIGLERRVRPSSFLINGKYVIEAISRIEGDMFELSPPEDHSPVMIRGLENKSHISLIMPLKR